MIVRHLIKKASDESLLANLTPSGYALKIALKRYTESVWKISQI